MRANATSSPEASSSAHTPSHRSGASLRGGVVCPLLPTADGVILSDEAAPPPSTVITVVGTTPSYRGKVVAIGPDVVDLQVGDVVRYRPWVGARIEVDGNSWMLVREDECLCRLS